jgi:hypothetical protein
MFKGCPMCGAAPDVISIGRTFTIKCCVELQRIKATYLTNEHFETWNKITHRYSPEAEILLANLFANMWNRRCPEVSEIHHVVDILVDVLDD